MAISSPVKFRPKRRGAQLGIAKRFYRIKKVVFSADSNRFMQICQELGPYYRVIWPVARVTYLLLTTRVEEMEHPSGRQLLLELCN